MSLERVRNRARAANGVQVFLLRDFWMVSSILSARRVNLCSRVVTLVVTSSSFRFRWLMWLYWGFNSRVLMSSWDRSLPWEKCFSISLTLMIPFFVFLLGGLELVVKGGFYGVGMGGARFGLGAFVVDGDGGGRFLVGGA